MTTLEAQGVTLGYDGAPIVEGLDFAVPPGKVTMIVGANACGKSTLLRGLSRLMRPRGGVVLLDDRDVQDWRSVEVATLVGLLPQQPVAPDGITVRDLVGRGRYPHQGWFRQWSADDTVAVDHALEVTGTADLAHRPLTALSGGQRQRVWIAMALAQDTEVLLLDEPTTFLDIAHQVELLDLLLDLNQTRGTTIVAVLHDLNLACRYADHLVAMKDGRIVVQGNPSDVVTAAVVHEVFGLESEVLPDPISGTPLIVPRGRHRAAVTQITV